MESNLPSGKTIADYHRYIRECLYVKLRGSTGGENEDDDDVMSTTAEKDDQQHDSSSQLDVVNPKDMPEDYCFSGMIAFFLWGFIIEDPQQYAVYYQSKRFQIGDSVNEGKGANSRRQVKKEAGRATYYKLPSQQ